MQKILFFFLTLLLCSCVSVKDYKGIIKENTALQIKVSNLEDQITNSLPYINDTALLRSYDSLKISSIALKAQNLSYKKYFSLNSSNYTGAYLYDNYVNYSLKIAERPLEWKVTNDFSHDLWGEDIMAKYIRFPIPPPKPTSKYLVPDEYFKKNQSILGIDSVIKKILQKGNLQPEGYYPLDDNYGTALIVGLQEFDPVTLKTIRQLAKKKPTSLKIRIMDFFENLLFEQKGYYRLLTFLISDKPLSFDGDVIDLDKSHSFKIGVKSQVELSNTPGKYHCYFLVYEFEKGEYNKNPNSVSTSKFTAEDHFKALNFL